MRNSECYGKRRYNVFNPQIAIALDLLFTQLSFPRHLVNRAMGVKIETVIKGDGKTYARVGDRITVHYVGTLPDGAVFDSTRRRGEPFTTEIGLGRVIKGWDEGMPKLSLGEKAVLTVSPDYAYGTKGVPPLIPPNAELKFEVEVISIF